MYIICAIKIIKQLLAGDFFISESGLQEMINEYLALVITVIDILNGASYLFDKKTLEFANSSGWKESLELKEYRRLLGLERRDAQNAGKESTFEKNLREMLKS